MVELKRFCTAPKSPRELLIAFRAASRVAIAVCAFAAVEISAVATELNALVVELNTSAPVFPATTRPWVLAISILPVTIVESLPAPLTVTALPAPAIGVITAVLVAAELVKSNMLISRPSAVLSVMTDLSLVDAKEAVTPVKD